MQRQQRAAPSKSHRLLLAAILCAASLAGTGCQTVSEVNLALRQPTFMSSEHDVSSCQSRCASERAVDGDKSTSLDRCSLTRQESNPWWAVRLFRDVRIAEVVVTNRNNYPEKLSDFLLGLTDVSPTDRTPASLSDTDYMVCAQYVGTVPAGQTVHIQCSTLNTSGRYMFLLRRGPNRYLQLCEMEVYAWKVADAVNVAANRPTSSVGASSELYPASQAVEGSRQTAIEFCYSSAHVVAPWWAVDLGRSKLLETIVVTTFGVDGFYVGATDVSPAVLSPVDLGLSEYMLCANYPDDVPINTTEFVSCRACSVRGRYLFVVSPGGPKSFVLCEVEVYLAHCGQHLYYPGIPSLLPGDPIVSLHSFEHNFFVHVCFAFWALCK